VSAVARSSLQVVVPTIHPRWRVELSLTWDRSGVHQWVPKSFRLACPWCDEGWAFLVDYCQDDLLSAMFLDVLLATFPTTIRTDLVQGRVGQRWGGTLTQLPGRAPDARCSPTCGGSGCNARMRADRRGQPPRQRGMGASLPPPAALTDAIQTRQGGAR